MLKNAYLLAKIGADTAENERNFAEILPKNGNYPTGRRHRRPGQGLPFDVLEALEELPDVHEAGPVHVHDVEEVTHLVGVEGIQSCRGSPGGG